MRRLSTPLRMMLTCCAVLVACCVAPAIAAADTQWQLPLTKPHAKELVKLGWGTPTTSHFRARCRITSARTQTCVFKLRYIGADGVYQVRGRAYVSVTTDAAGSLITHRRVKYRKVKQCRIDSGYCYYGPKFAYADHWNATTSVYDADDV